ncbi:MAG: nucleotidyltransferase family protein, partial [Bulleidia sp.]|nr:nucleotidyltransferase family protein [Bulleidia sp.]
MTREFGEMLRFFGASALGYDIKKIEDIDIATIRRLAIEQGIWTIIYEPLSKVYDLNRYKSEFIFAVTRAIQQREFTLKVIRQLEREGVECCILKGAAVARLYAEPDCRISSDTDILIALQNEKKAEDVLKKNGYSFEKRAINDHHLKAYHPIGGLLEIHVRLYSHSTEQIIFNGLKLYSESCET